MPKKNTGIMKEALTSMLRDLKTIYTDTWFLAKENFNSAADAWYKALGNYSYDQLRDAFDRYVQNNSKPPTPSQIRELIFDKAETQQTTFDPDTFWREFNYWVLTDLRGYFINEIIASTDHTADDIAEHFKKLGHDMTGTVLKKEIFGKYKPKYLPAPNPAEEEVIREFAPREKLVTSSPRIEDPAKMTAFETRRRQMLDQAEMFTK